jgi:FKBP-type peptidyl-prolyl cis-trans isomerase SlyD
MKKLAGLLVMSGAVLAALFFLTSLARIGGGSMPHTITLKSASAIHEGAVVSIEYTLTDEAGTVIDSNVGKDVLSYIHGAGQIVRGLERELNGLKVGDRKKVQVKPQDGYGPINEKAFQEIPREGIPPEAQKAGTMLMTKAPDGRAIPVRVHEVKDKTVVVDFNHPLAGKTLNFDVKVMKIRAAEAK